MPIQEIITYLVVTTASGFVFYSLFKTLFPGEKDKKMGCSSNCNCDAKVMRKQLLRKAKTY